MDCLGPTWQSLYTREDCTIFQSFAWNRLAARAFLDREEPYCVMVSTDSGAAIIPAAIAEQGRRIALLGEVLFDYRDVLTGGSNVALRRAWGELARLKLPLSVTAVRNSALPHWHEMGATSFCQAPQVLRSEISAAQFESSHRRLGRWFRRCEREGLTLVERGGSESKLLRWIYQQKSIQFAGARNNLFADERRIEFLVSAAAMEPNQCGIFTLENQSRVVAALVTFRDRSARRFYTIYCDRAWSRYSPGQVLLYEVTRRSLTNGLDCDYMTGEQHHKTRLATSSAPLYKIAASAHQLELASSCPVLLKVA
jgi:CelD/BcsL family acetyltransferase involved in cellulose biosynthesis